MSIDLSRSMILFENIELTDEETESVTRYEKSFGRSWVERCLQQKRARKYLDTICDLVKEQSSYATPYNCCRTGYEVYRRKDGLPIRDDDLVALRAIDKGQENSVTLSQNGMEMAHRWLCDSSG